MKAYFKSRAGKIVSITILFFAIAIVGFVDRRSDHRTTSVQFASCVRVQVLRDQTNALTLAEYDKNMNDYKRERRLVKEGPSNADIHRESAKNILTLTHELLVTGPTRCYEATYNAEDYRPPNPEFVYKGSKRVEEMRRRYKENLRRAAENRPALVVK